MASSTELKRVLLPKSGNLYLILISYRKDLCSDKIALENIFLVLGLYCMLTAKEGEKE